MRGGGFIVEYVCPDIRKGGGRVSPTNPSTYKPFHLPVRPHSAGHRSFRRHRHRHRHRTSVRCRRRFRSHRLFALSIQAPLVLFLRVLRRRAKNSVRIYQSGMIVDSCCGVLAWKVCLGELGCGRIDRNEAEDGGRCWVLDDWVRRGGESSITGLMEVYTKQPRPQH